MGFPGDQDFRSPRSWQRPGSGYQPAGPLRRDPVRGFPPTPGARDAEYASVQASGRGGNGAHPGGNGGFGDGGGVPGHDGDVRTADGHRPGIETAAHGSATAAPRAAKAWNTSWGGGPWMAAAGTGGSLWPPAGGNGSGAIDFAGSMGASTWTYGEDEPTETWTLRTADLDTRFGAADSGDLWGPREETGEFGAVGSVSALAAPANHPPPPPPAAPPAAPTAAPVRGRRRVSPGRADRDAGRGTRRAAGGLSSPERPAGERRGENAATAGTASPRARRLRGGHARIIVATALAVIAAAGAASAGAFALTKHGHASAANTTRASARPSATPTASPQPLGKWKYIQNRADDPIPLTLAELFPASVSAGGRTYMRTAQSESTNCRKAVFGTRLKAAVRKGCSQALRASYLSANHRRMGTIGVLNLATSAAAAKLGKIVAAPRQFIEPLPADHGPTRNMGKGNGLVWAVAKGHYLILMWVQYANLQSPATSAERKILMQFVNDLYQETANQSLTGRMVTGKPLTP